MTQQLVPQMTKFGKSSETHTRLAEIYEIATIDSLMKDLEILERLDAMFDKCVKRLLMVRGLKSITSESVFSTSETSRRTPESCVTGK